ncbi:MAG TPA: serine hydrolase domain-containing protein [Pyrinomonadaceae bacterium]|nr:serine hydrolase domain-containing protein [Pyrinomonadaceae bacterium]
MKKRHHLSVCVLVALVALGVMGQAPTEPVVPKKDVSQPPVPGQAASGPHEMTAADVETFLDGLVPLQINQDDIAGVTISVVKDGKLLFAKGYGYADVEKKKPVSPQETLFRPGSISKLFTWTAVMQLYEQGKLDLDRDVNEYLDYKIPDAFGKPITLKNILSHTPGFEEQIKDLFLVDSTKPNLGQYLKTHIPARIYPPGTVPAYSNYATAVAGYIVERVSGRPFDEYVAENILKPLNMTRSTFTQPLPADLAPLMSNGYRLGSDAPGTFEVINAFPAGSLSSSATDMAQFMMAHLAEGQLGNARILKPETARLMHSRLFALDDNANAMCYGFYEESRNGHRIIGHGGDTIYFHSDLHLVLDQKLGFFVSYNSGGRSSGGSGRLNLWHAFLNRYYPYTPSATASATAKDDAKAASGTYILSRRAENSFLKTASLISQFTVSPVGDGDIEIPQLTGANGKPKRWQAVGPMTFLERDGHDKLIFKPDQSGRMQMVLPYPFFIGERAGSLQNGKLLLTVLGISLGLMLLTLILWPVGWGVRKHYGRTLELTPTERLLRILVRIVFVLDLVFIGALFGLTMYGLTHLEIFSDQGNKWFRLIQIVGVLGAIGTLAVFVNMVLAWISKRRRIWGKLQATVMLLACLGVLWFAFAGNLLRFSSTY